MKKKLCLLAALCLPSPKVFGAAVEKRQALSSALLFLFDKGIEVPQRRSLPALALISGKAAGLRSPRAHPARLVLAMRDDE